MYQIFNLVLLLYVLLVLTPFSGFFFTLNLKKKKTFSFETDYTRGEIKNV